MASLSLTHLGACERVPSDLGLGMFFSRTPVHSHN